MLSKVHWGRRKASFLNKVCDQSAARYVCWWGHTFPGVPCGPTRSLINLQGPLDNNLGADLGFCIVLDEGTF